MFGWNALALILKDQGVYDAGCAAERAGELMQPLHAEAAHQSQQLHAL